MTISPHAKLYVPSPNHSGPRTRPIDTVTIHHCAGNITMRNLGRLFQDPDRKASSNYGIGSDGEIACFVDEGCRSWCSSNEANDQRAVTIEVANCTCEPDWKVSDAALDSLVILLADIVSRNPGLGGSLRWRGSRDYLGMTTYQNITLHKWFAPTMCPGPYLIAMMPEIVQRVNRRLGERCLYTVQVGAFKYLSNAQNYLKQVRQHFPEAYIKEVIKDDD